MAGSAWTNQLVDLIILNETAGYSGLFTYVIAPALGSLVFSISGNSGTDPDGNGYVIGMSSYTHPGGPGGEVDVVNIFGSTISWLSAPTPAGPFTQYGSLLYQLSGTSAELFLMAGGPAGTINLIADGGIFANGSPVT